MANRIGNGMIPEERKARNAKITAIVRTKRKHSPELVRKVWSTYLHLKVLRYVEHWELNQEVAKRHDLTPTQVQAILVYYPPQL